MRHLSVLFLTLSLLACKKDDGVDEATRGELGRVDFKYRRSCFFGCPLAQPLLAGTRESIEVSGPGNAAGVTPRSSDEDVLRAALERQCYCQREDSTNRLDVDVDGRCPAPWTKRCENRVVVEALADGEATLELLDDGDDVIDRAEVIVREAASAKVFATLPSELGEVEGDTFALAQDEQLELRVELYAQGGLELLAPEGVSWRVADPSIATLSAFLLGAGPEIVVGKDVVVQPLAPGATQIEIDVPGLTQRVDVEVD